MCPPPLTGGTTENDAGAQNQVGYGICVAFCQEVICTSATLPGLQWHRVRHAKSGTTQSGERNQSSEFLSCKVIKKRVTKWIQIKMDGCIFLNLWNLPWFVIGCFTSQVAPWSTLSNFITPQVMRWVWAKVKAMSRKPLSWSLGRFRPHGEVTDALTVYNNENWHVTWTSHERNWNVSEWYLNWSQLLKWCNRFWCTPWNLHDFTFLRQRGDYRAAWWARRFVGSSTVRHQSWTTLHSLWWNWRRKLHLQSNFLWTENIWKNIYKYPVCHFCCLSYFVLVGSWNVCNLESRAEHVVGTLEEFISFLASLLAFVETLQGNGRQDDHWPRPSSTMAWLAMENGWWEVWNTPMPSLM